METAYAKYKSMIETQPLLDDGWFGLALALARQGDDEARRRILGSGLRLTLPVAEALAAGRTDIPFWDLVQEANFALTQSLHHFTGSLAGDFAAQVERDVRSHLQAFTQ
jgi:DNA-directed RNA polymerase sigma subunit (sigma70/sigma32)